MLEVDYARSSSSSSPLFKPLFQSFDVSLPTSRHSSELFVSYCLRMDPRDVPNHSPGHSHGFFDGSPGECIASFVGGRHSYTVGFSVSRSQSCK